VYYYVPYATKNYGFLHDSQCFILLFKRYLRDFDYLRAKVLREALRKALRKALIYQNKVSKGFKGTVLKQALILLVVKARVVENSSCHLLRLSTYPDWREGSVNFWNLNLEISL
jgi:hypothetical protein